MRNNKSAYKLPFLLHKYPCYHPETQPSYILVLVALNHQQARVWSDKHGHTTGDPVGRAVLSTREGNAQKAVVLVTQRVLGPKHSLVPTLSKLGITGNDPVRVALQRNKSSMCLLLRDSVVASLHMPKKGPILCDFSVQIFRPVAASGLIQNENALKVPKIAQISQHF